MEEKDYSFGLSDGDTPFWDEDNQSNDTSHPPPEDIQNVIRRLKSDRAFRTSFSCLWDLASGLSTVRFYQGSKDFPTFAEFGEQVFSMITSTINDFQVSVNLYGRDQSSGEDCRCIISWLFKAIGLGATRLDVSIISFSDMLDLDLTPDLFSSFQGIEYLRLSHCGIKLPDQSIKLNLPRLLELCFYSCKFKEGELQRLVASCPSLRLLRAGAIGGLGKLEIDMQNLEEISLLALTTDNISFKYCPNLQKVHIDSYPPNEYDRTGAVHPPQGLSHLFLGTCSLIQTLELGGYTLKKLSRSYIPHSLAWQFHCLRYMMVRMDLRSLGEISVALFLFRSSPNMSNLNISADRDFTKVDDQIYHLWSTRESLDFSLNHLIDLQIHNLRSEYSHLELCKFLLSNTTMLRSFYVEPLKYTTEDEVVEMMNQLRSYDKIASPNVTIW